MRSELSTDFVGRLRSRDPDAWFELWETFGPILAAQLRKWGRGRIGVETVKDLSQETMAALASGIDRHDPSRGARFSTWLLAIAKYTLSDEMDRRMAGKRGGGQKPATLDESWQGAEKGPGPDAQYHQMVFDAKVEAAVRLTQRESDFTEFAIYQMRVFEGQSGKAVAKALATSEPTVTRKLTKIRGRLRERLAQVIAKYSFTEEEKEEALRNGLELSPTKADDALFDEALAEVYRRQRELRAREGLTGA